MNSKNFFFCALLLCSFPCPPAAKIDEEIQTVRREIDALTQLKEQKLDKLERIETNRWNARYNHNEEMKLLESRLRQAEGRYTSRANAINRLQEDILLLKNGRDEEQRKREEAQNTFDGFLQQVDLAIDEEAEKLDTDFPWQITRRTALYSALRTREENQGNNSSVGDKIRRFLADKYNRLGLTDDQMVVTRSALFSDGREHTVWTLRLGTVCLVDVDKNSEAIQTLMRTGALEGARYEWRRGMGEDYREQVMRCITADDDNAILPVPLEVLQNGKVGVVETAEASADRWSRFMGWFQKGGLIMYPLMLCAFIACILSLERYVTLTWRHHRYLHSYKKLIPFIINQQWDNARLYCSSTCTGLTRAIQEIVKRRDGSRDEAEHHVQQILLSEVPQLEKRLSILSTLGATAPLLGLLGTVSGMITLFRVITETGTNDARILAGGISEALVTTQTGLIVAIPILLIHGYLTERLDDILAHYNETVLEVFNIVFTKNRPDV